MYILKALKVLLVVEFVAALATLAIVAYRNETTALGISNISTIVAIAIGVVGTLIKNGAAMGGLGPIEADMAASVADDPKGARWARYDDYVSGLSYGVILIVGAVIWLLITVGLYKLLV